MRKRKKSQKRRIEITPAIEKKGNIIRYSGKVLLPPQNNKSELDYKNQIQNQLNATTLYLQSLVVKLKGLRSKLESFQKNQLNIKQNKKAENELQIQLAQRNIAQVDKEQREYIQKHLELEKKNISTWD